MTSRNGGRNFVGERFRALSGWIGSLATEIPVRVEQLRSFLRHGSLRCYTHIDN